MQKKSAQMSQYQEWPQATGILLEGSARPAFLGDMRARALAVEASASGCSAFWAVYRADRGMIDKDRYATSGTANSAGWVPMVHLPNDDEHHRTALPGRVRGMSGIRG